MGEVQTSLLFSTGSLDSIFPRTITGWRSFSDTSQEKQCIPKTSPSLGDSKRREIAVPCLPLIQLHKGMVRDSLSMAMSMTADQLLDEIKALPYSERKRLFQSVRELVTGETEEIPADFIEALDDFEHGRFVPMETALSSVPPGV